VHHTSTRTFTRNAHACALEHARPRFPHFTTTQPSQCLCCVRERVNPHTQVSHRALAPTHRCLLAQLNIPHLPLSKAVLLCTHRISICWRPHTRAWAHTCTRGTRTFTPEIFQNNTNARRVLCVSELLQRHMRSLHASHPNTPNATRTTVKSRFCSG
jgi:hypothetical protein